MSSLPASALFPLSPGISPSDFVQQVRATISQEEGSGPRYFNPVGIDYENRNYYAHLPKETADTLIGLVTLEFAALARIAGQTDLVYGKGAITGGAYALREAIRKKAPTLHRLSEHIGSPRSQKHIAMPNTRTNQVIGSYLQKAYPDLGIAAPTAREMSARKAMQHKAFGGLQFQDVDFMVLWYMLQMHFEHVAPFVADWNATRNTINESVMETLIESGLVASRPKADIRLVDINGQPVSLLARMEKYGEILKIALAHEIDFREAAQAFCISATLDNWRRTNDPRAVRMNRRLRRPAKDEYDKIDQLRAEIDPLIVAYAASHLRPDDLLPEYQEACSRAKTGLSPEMPADLRSQLKDFAKAYLDNIEDKTSINMDPVQAAALQRIPTPVQRRFDPDGNIFDPSHRARFFHDDQHLYSACSEWEQALLPFVLWAMEIVLLPHNNPMVSVVLDDFKRGSEAERYRKKHALSHIDEALPHAGPEAAALILDREQKASRARVRQIKKVRPGKVVIGPADFQFIFGVMEELRATIPHFIGDGPNRTSPAFRQLFRKIFIERNADEVFFPEQWALSPELVQLRNAARNIQCEFVNRPIDGPVNFNIYTERRPQGISGSPDWLFRPDTLVADAHALVAEFRKHAMHMTEAPEQGLALARLWGRNQLLRPENSSLINHDVVRAAYASIAVMDFNKHEMDQMLGRSHVTGRTGNFLQMWGVDDCHSLRHQLVRPHHQQELPSSVDDLLTKFAFLWVVPSSRLQPRPLPDDGPERRNSINLEHQLMACFAEAQASAQTTHEWLKTRRPSLDRHVVAIGPQS